MWFVRNKLTKEIVRSSYTPFRIDGKIPDDLDPSLEIVIEQESTIPEFDPTIEKLESFTEEIASTNNEPITLLKRWNVIPLTELEKSNLRKLKFKDAQMWQIKIWLARNNINPSTIPTILDQLFVSDPSAAIEAKTRWESVPLCPRDHPLVSLLGGYLGLTSEQIDVAWPDILNLQ